MKQELNLVQEMLTGEIFIADKGKIVDEKIVDRTSEKGGGDTDDMDHVFFEARQINIALLNHITYNEFLPAVIGEANVNRFLQLRRVSI